LSTGKTFGHSRRAAGSKRQIRRRAREELRTLLT
jgi:hypothetical protein